MGQNLSGIGGTTGGTLRDTGAESVRYTGGAGGGGREVTMSTIERPHSKG